MKVELAALCLANHNWKLEIYQIGRERDGVCMEEIREQNWWQEREGQAGPNSSLCPFC